MNATEFLERAGPLLLADEALHNLMLGVAADEGGVLLWELEGEPVSMCGYGSPTPNGIRIGAVYTPPEHPGQGYAAAVTADVSRRQLERGRFCFLYTDATNATAEGIYARLGYQCIAASRQLAFA